MIFIRHKQSRITVAEPYFFANESIFWAIDISEKQFSVYLHLFHESHIFFCYSTSFI